MSDIQRGSEDQSPAICPQCGQLMVNMGHDFEAPKKDDLKEWAHMKELYSVGITFHSCGCTGPGYIPKDKESLTAYFRDILDDYQLQLNFWRNRTEPTTEKEIQRENSKHWDNITQVPYELRPKKGAITNEEAKTYWLGRINEVEQKLKSLTSKKP
jgi:hypothetical protein